MPPTPLQEREALGSVSSNVPPPELLIKPDLLPAAATTSVVTPAENSADADKAPKPGKKRHTLGKSAVAVMKEWMFSPEHFYHPYPTETEKQELAEAAGITLKQLSNWFTNARKRLWQPMMRERQFEVSAIRYKRMRSVLADEELEAYASQPKRQNTAEHQTYDSQQLIQTSDSDDLHAASALLGLARW